MQLFKVPAGKRVRIASKLIRWVDGQAESVLAEGLTWEGTTTDRYAYHRNERRRLIIDHTIDWPEFGVWQRDTTCEIVDTEPDSKPDRTRTRRGVLIND